HSTESRAPAGIPERLVLHVVPSAGTAVAGLVVELALGYLRRSKTLVELATGYRGHARSLPPGRDLDSLLASRVVLDDARLRKAPRCKVVVAVTSAVVDALRRLLLLARRRGRTETRHSAVQPPLALRAPLLSAPSVLSVHARVVVWSDAGAHDAAPSTAAHRPS